MLSIYFHFTPLKLPDHLEPNYAEMMIGRSSTKYNPHFILIWQTKKQETDFKKALSLFLNPYVILLCMLHVFYVSSSNKICLN